MDFSDCVKFANDVKTCYLATADGDQPRVRAMGMWYADEQGFWFQSQSVKALKGQLEKNPKVELCFCQGFNMMRVYGKAKIITDRKIRAKCFVERPTTKHYGITSGDDPLLLVFQVYTGEAYMWTLQDSMKEASLPRYKFGK